MCLEAGVNLFDTANIYSDGRSEEVLGEAIKGRRDDLLLATKVRMLAEAAPTTQASPGITSSASARSLKRLGTDHIDLYQVHEWTASPRSRRHSRPSTR